MAKIAVLGYGTVGSGIVEVIKTNQELINKRAGKEIDVKYILDLRDFPGDAYEDLIVHDADVIMNDPEVDIVCEAMGGIGAAYTFTKAALSKGKSVCTSNKALVAEHGTELLELAKANQCNYLFEASCGGGIPIIRPLRTSLSPEKIVGIKGILNGTTNYILTKMEQEGADFDAVLKDAQALGYAEANPEADIEGHDACRKIAILSSLGFGNTVYYQDVYTEGITKITIDDFAYMKQLKATIKLLGISKEVDGKYFAMVAPFVLTRENPLYSVEGVMNAILVTGNTLGDTMYYGAGAGKLPTASAVVSDVIDCALHTGIHLPCNWASEKLPLSGMEQAQRKFFVRVAGTDEAKVKAAFGDVKQLDSIKDNELAFVTPVMTEKAYQDAAAEFEVISMIRVDM
jgi:homoserine dehydrogenase